MDDSIEHIEKERRKREAELLLLLLLLGLQSRRFVLHAVRLGTDPQAALRTVWLGGSHFRGAVKPLAAAMADAHTAGYLEAAMLAGDTQAAVTVDWRQYEPAAQRAASLALDTMQKRLTDALAVESSANGQIQAVRDAFAATGWTGKKPAAMVALSSSQIVGSYGAGMYAASIDSQKVMGFVHRSVLDNHTTLICEDRDGLRLPKDDPYWLSNFPPLHFNCRSLLMPVLTDGPWSNWRPTVPPMVGFGTSPISFLRRAA